MLITTRLEQEEQFSPELLMLVLSFVIHAVFLSFFSVPPTANQPPVENRVKVSIRNLQPETSREAKERPKEQLNKDIPAVPERQIVPPSVAPESEPIKPTPYLSDRSTRVEKEMIKRGTGAETSQNRSRPEAKPPSTKNQVVAPKGDKLARLEPKGVPSLRLNEKTLTTTLDRAEAERAEMTDSEREKKFAAAQPFSRFELGGIPGAPDFLPAVPDGQMTLLNAKADKFAVFVRRVALQVFGALRRTNWRTMTAGEISRIRSMARIKAIMSPEGKLLKVMMMDSSGNQPFDQVVLSAVKEGSWDQNPPPTAVSEDGNIHFVFQSRVWSRMGGRGISEQRWLLLGTGLESGDVCASCGADIPVCAVPLPQQ